MGLADTRRARMRSPRIVAGGSTAALLLSYLLYPYFMSGEQALVMRAAHCLAAAAAQGAPTVAMASLLPSDDGITGPSKAVRAALAAALSPQAAADQPALFNAACDLVAAAARAHPSLLDAMMFPSALGGQRQKVPKTAAPWEGC